MLAQRQAPTTWSNETFIGYGENSGPLNPEGLSTSIETDAECGWSNRIATLTKELEDMESLQNNWDGEGAVAPETGLVSSAIDLLGFLHSQMMLPPPDRLASSPNGNIVLEWQFKNNVYLEAEITEPFRVVWMLEQPAHPTQHWPESWIPAFERRQRFQRMRVVK